MRYDIYIYIYIYVIRRLKVKNSKTVRVCPESTAAEGYSVDLESTNRHELCRRHWSGERSSRTAQPLCVSACVLVTVDIT